MAASEGAEREVVAVCSGRNMARRGIMVLALVLLAIMKRHTTINYYSNALPIMRWAFVCVKDKDGQRQQRCGRGVNAPGES